MLEIVVEIHAGRGEPLPYKVTLVGCNRQGGASGLPPRFFAQFSPALLRVRLLIPVAKLKLFSNFFAKRQYPSSRLCGSPSLRRPKPPLEEELDK